MQRGVALVGCGDVEHRRLAEWDLPGDRDHTAGETAAGRLGGQHFELCRCERQLVARNTVDRKRRAIDSRGGEAERYAVLVVLCSTLRKLGQRFGFFEANAAIRIGHARDYAQAGERVVAGEIGHAIMDSRRLRWTIGRSVGRDACGHLRVRDVSTGDQEARSAPHDLDTGLRIQQHAFDGVATRR